MSIILKSLKVGQLWESHPKDNQIQITRYCVNVNLYKYAYMSKSGSEEHFFLVRNHNINPEFSSVCCFFSF